MDGMDLHFGIHLNQIGMPQGIIKNIPPRERENPNITKTQKVAVIFQKGIWARVGTAKGGMDHKTPPPRALPTRMERVGNKKVLPHPNLRHRRICRGARALGSLGPRARPKRIFPHEKKLWEVLI